MASRSEQQALQRKCNEAYQKFKAIRSELDGKAIGDGEGQIPQTVHDAKLLEAEGYFNEMIKRRFILVKRDSKGKELYSLSKKGEKFLDRYGVIDKVVSNFRL